MLTITLGVAFGIILAVVVLTNPEIVGFLFAVVLYGSVALALLFGVFLLYSHLSRSDTAPVKEMAPVSIKAIVDIDDAKINEALSKYEPININCTQKVLNRSAGIQFEYAYKKYILIGSSCVPEGGNQDFNYVNLIEIDAMDRLVNKDSKKIIGNLSSIYVDKGVINVRYLSYKKDDANCCPTLQVNDKYLMQEGRLLGY